MSQIKTKFLSDNAVDDTKIKLRNNQYLKARNAADSGDVNMIKVNASDVIEFAAFPQKSGTPSNADDLANKSYVDAAINGLKWKSPVRVVATADITLANLQTIDTVSLAAGERVLCVGQDPASENGIYVVVDGGAWTRAEDANSSAEIPQMAVFVQEGSASNADTGWVCTTDGAITLDTTSLAFTKFTAAATKTAGAGMTETGNAFNVIAADTSLTVNADNMQVNLASNPGLEVSSGLKIKSDTSTANTLGITLTANGAGVKYDSNSFSESSEALTLASGVAGDGLALTTGVLSVKLEASNPSLAIVSDELGVKFDAAGAIVTGTGGIKVKLEASNPTLAIATNELGVKLDAAGAIITGTGGIKTQVDGTGIKITGNTLTAAVSKKETFTLNGTDITNQYIDLTQVALNDSIQFMVKGAGSLLEGASYDYSVSYTGGAGGKSRITFLNDLATGGGAALVSGDIVQVCYRY